MSDTVAVCCVDPDGRLGTFVATLRGIDDIAVTVADSADGVRPAAHDCCVVLHAPATPTLPAVDGLTLLDRLLDQGCPVPVAVYGHDIGDTEFTTRTFAKAVLDAGGIPMTMDPGRTELVARRIYHAVGRERHFQHDADLLDSLLDYFPHHIFIKDTAGRFAEASAVTAQEYDLAREELIGLTDYELLPRDHANDLYAEAQEILETGEPMVNKVEYYVDDDGQSHWVSTTKAPRYDADGTPIGIVGGTREVTEEKRQERMVRAIYEASRDLVRASDRAEIGEITVAIAEDIPALPRVQVALVDTSTGELAPVATDDTDIYDSYGDHYRTAFRDGQAQYIHTDGRVETDRETIAEPTAAVVPLGEHGALGVTTGEEAVDEFTLDLVTILAANVEAALDRAERERELEHQNERLEEFASIVSHDLRNPLSVASAYVDIARDDPKDEYFEKIDAALDRMGNLTDELLTLAKNGQTVGDTEPVDLDEVVTDAWATVSPSRATVETDSLSVIRADRSRLVELFENLFRNAVEHGSTSNRPEADDSVEHDSKGDTVRISVGMLPDGDGFYVEDDGPGIDTDEREQVFEMGYTDSADGTGYGLYIVKTIAEAHGWSVVATASAEGGARFEFTL
ncbi:sensor histidine kinase [Haloarcula pelagica]|uniref:sensor histidine kinase n=1 Tax=Haloarcula pelagica TaxID=3033389 RepID=UPI0024C3DDAE|nr:ATP-binding protein [Halomicroarcula sp. YJ-61-S]